MRITIIMTKEEKQEILDSGFLKDLMKLVKKKSKKTVVLELVKRG
jgi:hypothetical protein